MSLLSQSSPEGDTSNTNAAWLQQLASARAECHKGGGSVLDALLRHWSRSLEELDTVLLETTGVGCLLDGAAMGLREDLVSKEKMCSAQAVVLQSVVGNVFIAAADPWDDRVIRELTRGQKFSFKLCAATEEVLHRYLGGATDGKIKSSVENTFASSLALAVSDEHQGPIVTFVDSAINRAIQTGASDIHFECDRSGISVKLRLDGVMQKFARMESATSAQEVVSRIKVLAQLDITERRLPQDGRFRYGSEASGIDFRVSIMPSIHGEDAVLRLLDKRQFTVRSHQISMEALGFETHVAGRIRKLAHEPNGMMLVTGPTGSGKTTTLYAVLSEINDGLQKVITIEDPVEYELEGVLQIPVNERKGLTFARGLRSILRHDPDQILVGEIRDAETAEIAVQASLTGHQVFTTVHANNVADIMGRFKHFGLDMFGFISALNAIVVQRLIRKLCTHCAASRPITEEECRYFEEAGLKAPTSLPVARGCDNCHDAGYAGRFVIVELHQISDEFRDLVLGNVSLTAMKNYFKSQGIRSLETEGLTHVAASRTTLEELQRVVGAF